MSPTRPAFATLALLVLWGCGGGDSSGGASGTSGRLLDYGPVSSPVAERVATKLARGGFAHGQEVHRGDVVMLDGDAMSPSQVGSDAEIDRVLASGGSVMIVDAKEAHKEAMRNAKRAGGSVGGDSHAVLYSPFTLPSGKRGVHILDLAGDVHTTTKQSIVHMKTGTVQGSTDKKTTVRPLGAVAMERFAARTGELGDSQWVDPLASTIPATLPWMSVPYELIEQADDSQLNNQSIAEDVTFIFRGFYSQPAVDINSGFLANTILIEQDGTMTTGALTVSDIGPSGQYIVADIGWLQTGMKIAITPDRSNPSGQAVALGATGMTVNGDTYQGQLTSIIPYYDSSNTLQFFQPDWPIPSNPLTVPGWSLSTQDGDPQFFYYQQSPFDTSQNPVDYQAGVSNNQDQGFLPPAAASVGTLPISGSSGFVTRSRIDGPVRFNLLVGRIYTKLTAFFYRGLTVGAGGTVLEEDGNREFVLDLNQCALGGGTQQ